MASTYDTIENPEVINPHPAIKACPDLHLTLILASGYARKHADVVSRLAVVPATSAVTIRRWLNPQRCAFHFMLDLISQRTHSRARVAFIRGALAYAIRWARNNSFVRN